VLAEADERGLLPKRLRRGPGVEVELDHLPIAFVLVVEVVEDVEEPVLECELSGVRRVRNDARIRMCCVSPVEPMGPFVVNAAGRDGRAGEVEVIVE
jgi:hypothetical protein